MKTIYISAGHGKNDFGASYNGRVEKDETLKISLYMKQAFERNGFNVLMVRESDITVEPYDRYTMVKKSNADLCLCNHLNAFNTKASGSEIIHSVHNDNGFAYDLYRALLDAGFAGRRVFSKSYDSNSDIDYYFMHRMSGGIETYIIEYAFLDNDEDWSRYTRNWKQGVENIVKAVCKRYGVDYKMDVKDWEQWKIDLAIKSINELSDLGYIDSPELHIKKIKEENEIDPVLLLAVLSRMGQVVKGKEVNLDEIVGKMSGNIKITLDKN